VFSSYYVKPVATAQPQPAIFDSFLGYQFTSNLTDPNTVPMVATDPVAWPKSMNSSANGTALQNWAINQMQGILNGSAGISGNCSRCVAALEVGQVLAQQAPLNFTTALSALCIKMNYKSTSFCNGIYGASKLATSWDIIMQHADVKGQDGQWICNQLFTGQPGVSGAFCPAPRTIAQSTKGLITKPKPSNVAVPPRSGKTFKVPHLSDIHLDPRYGVGSEVSTNCGPSGCCRPGATKVTNSASLYGDFDCDAPYNLVVSALESIKPMTGTSANDSIGFSIFTGDLVVHMQQSQMSFDFQMYTETASYQMLNHFLPDAPVYAVLGNHDNGPEGFDAPFPLPGTYGDLQQKNYAHLASLWKGYGWLDDEAATDIKTHYAAYSVNHPKYPKLKIIALNTDFWYIANTNNYINTTDPDSSGLFSFLVSELQDAEDASQRVWLLGHVAPGWTGSQVLPSHSDLFYQIVDRYSPHVIANIFFGHSHADQMSIYYSQNGTNQTAPNALVPAWVAPSVSPLQGHSPAWRFYEVDTGDFNIYDAYTFTADASTFPTLDVSKHGPVWELEYSTRAAYGETIKWPQDAPLNATFWHQVTEAMKTNLTMVGDFNTYQMGTSPVVGSACASAKCAKQLVCNIRSGSVALGQQC
jgi:3',5'-cyclic AMP phosphodiesterase CpdA